MKQTARRHIAFFLVVVQLFVLCPFLVPAAKAAEPESETPALNKTVVGTVKFQSFNFLGDNDTGSDGVDYTSTFYYTDDYFSPSAIHETNSTDLKWSDMTASEMSLASMSFDFATAAYATNVGNVKTATSRTWDNTDYSDKAKNARDLLTTCGFTGFEAYDYDHAPTNDSIAYVIAHKKITVWDETANTNKEFTLIAVGVRGAGYGAEWASNVTIGDTATNKLPANGRHWGFDSSAVEICDRIQAYLRENNITQDAKYWITGFSRAGATANLVAGYVTDGAASTYHTRQQDVFGYTWECPQAASTNENALNYKNIHNILNAMDAVPKVSPDAFKHQRLGVDYVMPYYGNTTTTDNETYYTQMRDVLKTIAVGAYNYGGESYTEDPLIHITDPSQYPYNRTMRVRTITATQLIGDAIDGVLMDNFGTVDATGSAQKISAKHIDEFIDDLINVFLVSGAWNGKIGASNTTTALSNRTKFISSFQSDFRNVLGYLLDYSGPAFLGMVDALIDAIGEQLSLTNTATNIGVGLAFLNFYNYPTSTYVFPTLGIFNDPWVGKISWRNRSRREVLVEEAQPVVKNVIRKMVGDFVDPQGITRTQFESSMDHFVELVVNLYADELSRYNSNYFGTSLYYMWQILCTHEQEVVMSWIKSLDQNHINRGYRTLTVPKGTDVKLYLCRSGYGETLGFDTNAPLVAEVKNAAFVPLTDPSGTQQQTLDDRISVTESGSNMVVRYPSLLDLRFDVTTDTKITDLNFSLSDYRTNAMATALSDGEKQYDPAQFTSSNYTPFTSSGAYTWNTLSSSNSIPLDTNETLSITARHTASYNENDTSSNLFYNMRKHGDTTRVIDFNNVTTVASDAQTLSDQTSFNGQFQRNATTKTVTYQLSAAAPSVSSRQLSSQFTAADTAAVTHSSIGRLSQDESLTVVPASSVYYDDDLTGQTFTSDGHGYSSDIDDAAVSKSATAVSGTMYYTFYGSGIDVYCTTDAESGYVSAAVFRGSGADACVKANRVGSAVTVSNKSADVDHPRYNTPTISFTDLDGGADTYTLKIVANDNAKFKLDGVRVYNPVQAGTAAAEAQAKAGEGNTLYVNLHKMLVNTDADGFSVVKPEDLNEGFDKNTISGVLFIDDAEKLAEKTHYDADGIWHEEEFDLYATQFDAYKNNSPNNEIYLAAKDGTKTQAVTFQVNTEKAPVGSTIYIGMSAPETGSGEVNISGTGNGTKPVTSVMDMYYGIKVPSGGSITITNTGTSLISLTNLKIPNAADAKSIDALPAPERKLAMRAFFLPVTTETVELAAAEAEEVVIPEEPVIPEETAAPEETPAPTPAPTPTPTPVPAPTPAPTSSIQDTISRLFSSFVSSLFGSFSRLFG